MTDETYNGYTNYETWCVSLWIHNDFGDNEWMAERAREAIATARANPEEPFTFEGVEPYAQARYYLTDTLREAFDETMPELEGMWGNLLSAAFDRVDWRDLADGEIRAALDEEAIQ